MTAPSTFGTLSWEPTSNGGLFVLQTVPWVTMRVKRMFPRMEQRSTPGLWLRATPEVARDLEWLLTRYPLEMSKPTAVVVSDLAAEHRERESTRALILAGDHRLDLKEPARPAREYQLVAADLALSTGQLLLADDVGLGKTFSSLLMLRDPDTLPAVVVTLTHLPKQWAGEVAKSLPWLTTHVATRGQAYDVEADVLILNYAKLAGWSEHLAGQVRTVIFDEVQELRRTGSAKYIAAKRLAEPASWRMGLSATPVYNYGGEIFSILQILAPDAIGSRQEFFREWGGTEMAHDRVRLKDPGALGTYLRDQGLMLRRTRTDVHREIPDPIRIVHTIDHDPSELDAIAGDVTALAQLIADSDANPKERFRASGEIDWRMRQATGLGKASYVAEFVRLLLESEEKVVLFGWHRAVYDHWLDALAEFNPVLYSGSESTNQKNAAKAAFVDGEARVLIMSLRSGAGLDGLQHVCSIAVFGELDWSPEMHNQCIGRLARDGQEATVAAYFLITDDGTDPLMAEVLELKRQQSEPLRDPNLPLVQTNDAGMNRVRLLVDAVLSRSETTR
ncbi:DEAD/DEAH box helicase [Nocardioides alkalitolerans]|uniref:SNF2-related protein n=1 Tax=Nocardioides alkalitolerans TaxID=281714 RepID=UPI00041900DE|nr:DEAD/DEAH box helicase [Nocardioides alkalitolerans]